MKLLFIHGSGGCKESFRYQVQNFENAEAIDLPGHPIGEPIPSIDGYVEWLREYIHKNGYKDLVLAGHSLGAGIALLYALNYPEDLKGLISLDGGARLRVHPLYLEMLENAISEPSLLEKFFEASLESIDPEFKEVLKRRYAENGPAVTLNDMRACDKFDIMDSVNKITVPTLAICGSEDKMTPPKYTKFLGDNIPGARVVIISEGTHMVIAEKPQEVNRAIEDFLKIL